MSSPRFETGDELFKYVIAHGPPVSQKLRDSGFWGRSELADDLDDYFHDVLERHSYDELEPLMKVVRDNIRLASGDERDIELANLVGAPEDCFA